MIHRPAISRADLVWFLVTDPDCLEAAAASVGFCLGSRPRSETKRDTSCQESERRPVTRGVDRPDGDRVRLRPYQFWRADRYQRHDATAETPPWLAAAKPLNLADPTRGIQIPPSPPLTWTPLTPWSRLGPFVRRALSLHVPGHRVDVQRLVRVVSRGLPLRTLPRFKRWVWSTRCQILVDRSRRLIPYGPDQLQLIERVRRERGALGLDVVYMNGGVTGPVDRAGRPSQRYSVPDSNTPVLALTDLGMLHRDQLVVHQWLVLGRQLCSGLRRPTALAPCPRWRWLSESTRVWRTGCWDRDGDLPLIRDPTEPGPPAQIHASPPEDAATRVQRLLALVAAAVRVEPELLRAMRLMLPAPDQDVAMESDVWHHRDVNGTSSVFLSLALHADRRAYLQQLLEHPHDAWVDRLVGLLCRAHHPAQLPGEFLAEELTLLESMGYRLEPLIRKPLHDFFESVAKHLEFHAAATLMKEGVLGWLAGLQHRWIPGAPQTEAVERCLQLLHARLAEVEQPDRHEVIAVRSWRPRRGQDAPFPQTVWQVGQVGSSLVVCPVDMSADSAACEIGGKMLGSLVTSIRVGADGVCVHAEGPTDSHSVVAPKWLGTTDAQAVRIPLPADGSVIMESNHDRLTLVSHPPPDWATTLGRDAYGLYADLQFESVIQRFRWIFPGVFQMGSPVKEMGRYEDESMHQVALTRGYWLGDTACTQGLWEAVMGANPSRFKLGLERPVERVSWEACQTFLARLRERVGVGFRLPTEAQWEYACRSGTQTPFHFGDNMTPGQVNHNGTHPYAGGVKGVYRAETVAVKSLPCNGWGLYEMHGNVWEWCSDWYGKYPSGRVIDPIGPSESGARVVRGGSWFSDAAGVRSANRLRIPPTERDRNVGLRLALSP